MARRRARLNGRLSAAINAAIGKLVARSAASSRRELYEMAGVDRTSMILHRQGSIPRLTTILALCSAAEVGLGEFFRWVEDGLHR